jgi:hypothetical protein
MISCTRTLSIVLCLQFVLESAFALSASQEMQSYMDYAEGYISDKTYVDHEGQFTVLQVNKISSIEEFSFMIENILSTDADVVCLSMSIAEDLTAALYQELKSEYAHFYQANPLFFRYHSFQGELFVASKYPLRDFTFTPFAVENQEPPIYGFFDFVIEKDHAPLGRVYVSALETPELLQKVMEKIECDALFISPEAGPLFFSKEISFPGSHNIETDPLGIQEIGNWVLTRVSQKQIMHTAHANNSYSYTIHDILCKNDSEGGRSYGEYDISARRDSDGNTSVRAEIDYTREHEGGGRFSVGGSSEVSRNDRGNPSVEVEAHVSGKF